MNYKNKGSSTPTKQSSLAKDAISEEEKLRQTKKAELQKKYQTMTVILVGIIVVAVVLLAVQMIPNPQEPKNTDPQEPVTQVNPAPREPENSTSGEPIVITADNWSDYFVISKEIVDTSIVLADTALHSMQTDYTIRLKDYYVEHLDTKQTSKVSFTVTYKECMGLFDVDYKSLTYKEPDSFSAIKSCTASVALKYPQSADSQANIIYSATIMGGGEPDDQTGIGYVGREFVITSANGTLYLKR